MDALKHPSLHYSITSEHSPTGSKQVTMGFDLVSLEALPTYSARGWTRL